MSYRKIITGDIVGHRISELPDTPTIPTQELKEKFDSLSLDVIIPIFNQLIDDLGKNTSASFLGAKSTKNARGEKIQEILEALDSAIEKCKNYVEEIKKNNESAIRNINQNVENSLNISKKAEAIAKEANENSENALIIAENTSSSVKVAIDNLTASIYEQTHFIDPATGELSDIETIMTNMFNMLRPAPITAQEYDEKNYTAETYDSLMLTSYNYDMYAKNLL